MQTNNTFSIHSALGILFGGVFGQQARHEPLALPAKKQRKPNEGIRRISAAQQKRVRQGEARLRAYKAGLRGLSEDQFRSSHGFLLLAS